MSEVERGLLAYIAESPDDDTPRLVYADWLEENGQPDRAAYIRAACELERLAPNNRRRSPLQQEMNKNWVSARNAYQPLYNAGASFVQFRRGFPISAQFDAARLLAGDTGSLVAQTPIRQLAIILNQTDRGEALRELGEVIHFPLTARLRGLDFIGTQAVRQPVGLEGAQLIANSPELGQLKSLRLDDHAIGDAGARALAKSPFLGNLETLSLARNGLTGDGVRALVCSPALSKLREIVLSGNTIGNDGVNVLLEPRAAPWTLLGLDGTNLTPSNLRALASSPNLGRVTHLGLGRNHLTDEDALLLAQSPHLARLELLELNDNQLSETGINHLFNSPRLCSLRHLDCAGNYQVPESVQLHISERLEHQRGGEAPSR